MTIGTSKYLTDRIGTLIGVLSLIVAVTVGVLQFRHRTREITCNVTSSTELTSVSQVPGLNSEFIYKQKKVIHLWKIDLSIINSGNETLVGEGQHGTLIKDGLFFGFPNDTEILNTELTASELPITIEQNQPNVLELRFPQWKQGEKANVSVYITSQTLHASPLLPMITTRDIVDGNVLVIDAMNPPTLPKTLMDRLPQWANVIVKVVLSAVCLLLIYLGLYAIPMDLISHVKTSNWKKKYLDKFRDYVNGLPLSQAEKDNYVSAPYFLPDSMWQEFPGDKLTFQTPPSFTSFFKTLGFCISGAFVGIIGLLYISSNAFDLYLKLSSYF